MSYWNYIPGAAAAAGGESFIFCVAGQTAGASLTQNNDKYDPDANTWTAKTALSLTARNLSTAVGIASEVYAQGGKRSGALKDHAKYTIGTDAWSSLTDADELNFGRSHGKMNGNYYMTGGNTFGSPSGIADVDIHKYLVSGDSWSDTGKNTNNIMTNVGSGVVDRDSTSAVWIMLAAGPGTAGATDSYTLATDTLASETALSWPWSTSGAKEARNAGFTAGGNLYVHNGWDADVGTGMSNKVREYSVSGNSWAAKTATNNSKVDIAGASLDADGDTGYSIGGSDEGYYGDLVERYSVSGNSWTNVTTLNYAPQHQTGASA
jgi:hypothetical protein